MRIAIYSHSFPPSIDGVCRRISSLVYELLQAGHQLLIFTLEKDLRLLDLHGLPTPPHVTIQSFFPATYPLKRVALPTFLSMWNICRALQAFRPDVLHITVDAMTMPFTLCAHLLRIPVAGSIHTDVDKILRSLNKPEWVVRTGWLLESQDSFFMDSCATTSESYREELQRRWCWVDHVLLTSVNTEVFHPNCITAKERQAIRSRLTFSHPEGLLLLYVGRMSLEKSIDVLVTALQFPGMEGVYLALIGNGPTAPDLARLHGPKRRIYCVPGFVDHPELAKLYAAADVHVSASLFETLGNTVLEAHATGLPVIVPAAQGFKDTVCPEQDGFLFAPESVADFCKAVQRFQADRGLRDRLGREGRRKVESSHSPAAVAKDYVEWYQSTVTKHLERFPSAVHRLVLFLALLPCALIFIFTLRAYDYSVFLCQQLAGPPVNGEPAEKKEPPAMAEVGARTR
eukprot:EG_transcript_6523